MTRSTAKKNKAAPRQTAPKATIPTRKNSYKDALSALIEVLSDREKDLDERETKLRKDQEALDIATVAVYGETNPSDVLHLNIGGTKTTVLRRTLTSVPGSMLASKFSGRWDDSIEKDSDGDIFIDQDFSLFQTMLNYLRNRANGIEKYPMKSPKLDEENARDFYRMVEYYGMTDTIFHTKLERCEGTGSENVADIIGSKTVNTKEWTSFELVLDGHTRNIETYEIKLGDVKRIQVGWVDTYKRACFKDGKGAGEVKGSFALDLTRSSLLVDGETTVIENIEHAKGTVVRSENYGKVWYVNGDLVAPDSLKVLWRCRDQYFEPSSYNARYLNLCPLISIIGEMEVTLVEFEKI